MLDGIGGGWYTRCVTQPQVQGHMHKKPEELFRKLTSGKPKQ